MESVRFTVVASTDVFLDIAVAFAITRYSDVPPTIAAVSGFALAALAVSFLMSKFLTVSRHLDGDFAKR